MSNDLLNKNIHSEEEALDALDNGDSLENIPPEYRTFEVCRVAVITDGMDIIHLPDDFAFDQYTLLYESGVETDPEAIEFVPQEHLSWNIIKTALEKDGSLLQYIPYGMRDIDTCLLALENSSEAIDYVPKELKDEVNTRSKNMSM